MAEPDLSAFELPRSLAPAPRLSGRGFTLLLISTCLVPLFGLSLYTALFSRAHDTVLAVEVGIGMEPVEAAGGQGAIMTDIIWIRSLFDSDLSNVTIDLNGQYFLYRQAPLLAGERLVLPQQIFSTKSSQRWIPGRYPIAEINVTARLPSGRRAVKTVLLPAPFSRLTLALHLLPSGLSRSVQQLAATSPSRKNTPSLRPKSPLAIWDEGMGIARVFFMVAASCDPAWLSQTEIGNKNDAIKDAPIAPTSPPKAAMWGQWVHLTDDTV